MKENPKILIAMDSFKGSATSAEVATWTEEGLLSACPGAQITKFELADGGEGTLEAFRAACTCEVRTAEVHDAFGKPTVAEFLFVDGDEPWAVIESAKVIGLQFSNLTLEDALTASSKGVGELILAAKDAGAKKIYVGLGGTCTNDGGWGALEALHFENPGVELVALSDVENPLCGRDGAIAVFGPQKGLDAEFIAATDAQIKAKYEEFAPQVINKKGAGAAGGLGAALLALGAEIVSGTETILDICDFDKELDGADLVIVGEGRMDKQTLSGKAPLVVAKRAMAKEVPVCALVGSADKSIVTMRNYGIHRVFSIVNGRQPVAQDLTKDATHRGLVRLAKEVASL